MARHHLAAALFAAASIASSQTFNLQQPALVDFSTTPQNTGGQYVVTLSGTGFVPQMLLAAYVGTLQPFVVPFTYLDASNVTVAIPAAGNATIGIQLYKLGAGNSVLSTNRLETTFVVNAASNPNAYFVATSGSNSNPGTFTQPFETIDHGIGVLSPGDTLYIRGGTYYETPDIDVDGTASQPIVIAGYPGESVVIDSGDTRFRTPGNNDWELVNASLGEWRSTTSFGGGAPWGYVAGIPGYENERVRLIPYPDTSMFRETQTTYTGSSDDYYCGPGLRTIDGRLHIRLQKTPDFAYVEGRYGQVFASQSPDPRNYSILVSSASSTLAVRGSHLRINGLTVNQGHISLTVPNSVTDVVFRNVTVWMGSGGMRVNAPSSFLSIDRCSFLGDDPQWICWIDAKRDPAPCDDLRGSNLSFYGGVTDVEISRCLLRGGHDLMGINDDERRFNMHHCLLMNAADDACEWEGSDIGRVEFHHNVVLNSLVGISPGQDTPQETGPILVHHNLFALLRPVYVNRVPGVVGWNGGGRYGHEYLLKQHSENTFYYNNTMVMAETGSGKGMNITCREPDGTYAANNVMVMIADSEVEGGYRHGSGQIVDGNCYWIADPQYSGHLADGHDTVFEIFSGEGFEEHGIGFVPGRGTDPMLAWTISYENPGQTPLRVSVADEVLPVSDFFLSTSSPCRGTAVQMPTHPVFGALPEINASSDIGFHPFGAASQYGQWPFTLLQ